MKYVNVRLEESVFRRLVEYRDRLAMAIRRNPPAYPEVIRSGRLSQSDAVFFLLGQKDGHTRRAERVKARKRLEKRESLLNSRQLDQGEAQRLLQDLRDHPAREGQGTV